MTLPEPSLSPPFEAALILPVPEAEPVVAEYRQRYDRYAELGIPAHITINYPFKPYVTRPREALSLLRPLLAAFPEFAFTLAEILPHLTVAQAEEAALPPLKDRFSAFAASFLPIAARAREIWVMDNSETLWKTRAVFPLKAP